MQTKGFRKAAMLKGIFLCLLIIAANTLYLQDAQAERQRRIKFSHYYPSGSLFDQAAKTFADNVQRESLGQLKIRIYPGGILIPLAETIDAVKMGIIDLALIPSELLSEFVNEFKLFDLPYLFKDYGQVDKVLFDNDLGLYLLFKVRRAGMIGLGLFESGFIQFAGNIKIRTPGDFEGLNIRTPPNNIKRLTLERLGARTIGIRFNEIFGAFQHRIIDGAEISIQSADIWSFDEVVRYFSLINSYYGTDVLIVNLDLYNSLDDKLRKVMQNQANNAAKNYRNNRRQKESQILKNLMNKNKVNTDISFSEFQNTVLPLYETAPIASIIELLRSLCPDGCPLPPVCCD